MDSSTRLDYALFQLTPTRTRCDLVVFSGGASEKLASGLLEPFVSHLRFAKEQISKGGYSITLRAPTSDASWFTKATLERFVRFVSTPEVLERFVTIEREISQIETSAQPNGVSNTTGAGQIEEYADGNSKKSIASSKSKCDSNGTDEGVQEENSKLRLQRLLETRKSLLRKEQAMAYARAFVAGFGMEYIDDLISFSNAFGASRLREACINFKELCNKKHDDGLWMDELAAMEAYPQPELPYSGTSGIMLTSDSNNPNPSFMPYINTGLSTGQLEPNGSLDASVSDSTTSHASLDNNQDNSLPISGQMPPTTAKVQVPMSWTNQIPQYMYNFQSPNFQQMSPYQGYPFHGMQVVPPYYPGNMNWPPNAEESHGHVHEQDHHRNHKSSSGKKEKLQNGPEISEQDGKTDSSDSTSGSELDEYLQDDRKNSTKQSQLHKRRHRKKSSRMVVIRNINYVTSKRREGQKDGVSDESSSVEDEFIDGDSLKQKVEDAVGSLEKRHKSTSKRGGDKHRSIVNGSNGASEKDLGNDFGTNSSGEAKRPENWSTFQSLLMRNEESGANGVEKPHTVDVQDEYFMVESSELGTPSPFTHAINLESEKGTKKKPSATDSLIMTRRDSGNEDKACMENFESNENFHPSIKRRDCADEEFFFSQRPEGSERNFRDALSDSITESSVPKSQEREDWFIISQSSGNQDATTEQTIFNGVHTLALDGDSFHSQKNKKDILVDDSFMVQARSTVDEQCDSQWRTDISMVTDHSEAAQHENGSSEPSGNKLGLSGTYEPDDLYMVLERDSGVESSVVPWTPEMDNLIDISFTEAEKMHSSVEANSCADDKLPSNGKSTESKNSKDPETKLSGKGTRSKPLHGSVGKSKAENISRIKKPSTVNRAAVQKNKLEKEEEKQKKKEELLIQRQKRIAERSAASGHTSQTSKRAPVDSKTAITSTKHDKKTSQSTPQETKRLSLHKPGITSSTIDRLASGRVKDKESPTPPLRSSQPKKTGTKVNGVVKSTVLSPVTAADENKKPSLNQVKPLNSVNDLTHKDVTCSGLYLLNGTYSSAPNVKDKDQTDSSETTLQMELSTTPGTQSLDGVDTSERSKDLRETSSSVMKDEQEKTSQDKNCNEYPLCSRVSSLPVKDHSVQLEALVMEDDYGHASEINGSITEAVVYPPPTTLEKSLNSSSIRLEENVVATNEKLSVAPGISEIEITPNPLESIPSPANGITPEQTHGRKKWTNNESAKGFKKLLMFGRKSHNSPPS